MFKNQSQTHQRHLEGENKILHTPRERSSDPTPTPTQQTAPELTLSVSCRGTGQQ